MRLRNALSLAVLAAAAGGCMVGPDYARPAVDLPATFERGATIPGNPVPPDWWTLYRDGTLDRLVAAALANNADVRIAAAQVEESEAILRQADASLWPQFDLLATAGRSAGSTLTATPIPAGVPVIRDDRRIALATAYEIDFWGKFRRASESARAQALATRYGRDVVLLTLAGTTTQAYLSLRSVDAQVAVLQESVKSRAESLDVVQSRAEAGLASELDVYQALGAHADARAQLRELERQREVLEHLLGTLTGDLALKVPAGDLASLPLPPVPPPGLPSTLLERRPDLRAAEQNLVAANAQVGVATAAMFPSIALVGTYGVQSQALQNLFSVGGGLWSLGGALAMPVFDAGRNAARVDQYEARQRQSAAAYRKAVETAFREVADALASMRQASLTEADLKVRVDAARNALELAQVRYQAGYSGYLEVLDAQRTGNDAELALVRNRQARLAYTVDFMKALGGGWVPAGAGKD
jgi:multidrug efflux system outer membrane protein